MFDIIGDVHSCCTELQLLFNKLGYSFISDQNIYKHSYSTPIFVGDIIDRGYGPVGTFTLIRDMVQAGAAKLVRGNHDDKLFRYSCGRKVIQNHGLDKTIIKLEGAGISKEEIAEFFNTTPYYFAHEDLIVTHAAWHKGMELLSPFDKRCRTFCLYGPTTGKTLPDGLPDRIDWAITRKETTPIVVYGHQPYKEPRIINNTYGIDTGCVFGGHLTCTRYPKMEIVQVKSFNVYDTSKPDIGE